mmetsp:Transcript_14149/g.26501  ORF Transcript_14149/g.26501 Transcript_14149/m.26501 type:complete len:224 (-) Transcript_14149:14-685(-)
MKTTRPTHDNALTELVRPPTSSHNSLKAENIRTKRTNLITLNARRTVKKRIWPPIPIKLNTKQSTAAASTRMMSQMFQPSWKKVDRLFNEPHRMPSSTTNKSTKRHSKTNQMMPEPSPLRSCSNPMTMMFRNVVAKTNMLKGNLSVTGRSTSACESWLGRPSGSTLSAWASFPARFCPRASTCTVRKPPFKARSFFATPLSSSGFPFPFALDFGFVAIAENFR